MKYLAIFVTCWFSIYTPLTIADTTTADTIVTANETASVQNPTAAPLPDADQLLAQLLEGGIRPLYRELDASVATLVQLSETFCHAPNETNLIKLRQSWGNALLAWLRTDALLFGPAIENQMDFHINFNPPKKIIINQLLNATTPLDVTAVEAAGVGGQGLGTLEFLLFDRDKTAAQLLELFQGDTGKRRCDYVQAGSELLNNNVHSITQQWLKDGDNTYASQFRDAYKGNTTFANAQQAVDLVVNKLHQSAEKTAKSRLGIPLGKTVDPNTEGKQERTMSTKPYQLENWRSGYAIAGARASMEGILRLLRDGGVLEWLRTHNTQQVGKVVADNTELRLSHYLQLPLPTSDPFVLLQNNDSKKLSGYYYLANDIDMGLTRQLARVLGSQLGFNDSDGD